MNYNLKQRGRTNASLRLAVLASGTALALVAVPAQAQQTKPAQEAQNDQAQNDNGAIQEITVTAERRAQNSQDVPLALTTFSGDQVAPGAISSLVDVAVKTPNLTVTQFNIGEPQLYLRGIGSTLDSAAADPTVSVFLDEVYIGRPGSNAFDLYDLDRIEVLRGPQGTLYGRNVTGGAISIYSKKPSDTFEGKMGLTVGNYALSVIRGYVNGPIADGLNGKLSFSRTDRGGYSHNVRNGQELDNAGNFSIRGQLLAKPSSRTEITLSADYSRDRNNGDCRYMANLTSPDQAFNGLYSPLIAAAQASLGVTDPRECSLTINQFARRNLAGGSVRIQHDMDWATLTSITSYRYNKYAWLQELGGLDTPPGLLSVEDNEGETSKQWTQEIRLGGGGSRSRLQWVVGLYGLSDSVDRFANVPIRFGPTSPVTPNVVLDRAWKQNAHSKSAAIFGQATYEVVPTVSLTLGGRYTYDRKAIDQFYRQGTKVIYDFKDLNKSWERFTGRVTLDWKITPDVMAYATFSQGYKSGVFISQSTSGPAAATPLDPENATNWEAGFKSQFLDRHVQLNLTGFDLTVKNLQLFRLSGLTLVSENSNAKVKGLEGDLQVIPFRGLRLMGSLSVMDAKYQGGTFNGKELARAPKWKYTIGGDYTHNLANGGELSFDVGYTSTAGYFMESTNVRVSRVDPHQTLDASIKYESPNKTWDLTIWGKNLTDELIEKHSIVGTLGGSAELYMPPRTYGASFNVKF